MSFDMVKVKGGTFQMGGNNRDGYRDEKPVHTVELSDFYIGQIEVTQRQWRDVMGNDPSELKGCDNCPVENVSWDDVQEFLKKLNSQSKKQFRLPTEAEWEFAARGGNTSKGYKYSGGNNIDEVAWYYDGKENKTHPVGTKKANELGLHDMSGNVWEWCNDLYDDYTSAAVKNPTGAVKGANRVHRGGGWFTDANNSHVTIRAYSSPTSRYNYLGFRLVLSEAKIQPSPKKAD